MAPKITVFMAAYNAGRFIRESISSILTQTFADFELLIVNDGSTDNTESIVHSFTDPRIRLINNDRNRGLCYTRNVALKEAKGKYIAILDSDDLAVSNRLELQYGFLEMNTHFALCGGHGVVIDKNGNSVKDDRLVVPIGADLIKMTLLFKNAFVNSTVMYKTTVFRELNGYQDYAPAEDYDFFIRTADQYPLANLDKILVYYRDHDHNTSALKSETVLNKIKEIKKNQLMNLGIAENTLTEALLNILNWDFKTLKFADYLALLTNLKLANRSLQKYPLAEFEKMLFDYWFEIIYTKKAKMNALLLLFNNGLFSWEHINSRQIRKAFKCSLKGMGSISK